MRILLLTKLYERDFCSFMEFYLIKECYLNNNNNCGRKTL
jgi:hypothetical protein